MPTSLLTVASGLHRLPADITCIMQGPKNELPLTMHLHAEPYMDIRSLFLLCSSGFYSSVTIRTLASIGTLLTQAGVQVMAIQLHNSCLVAADWQLAEHFTQHATKSGDLFTCSAMAGTLQPDQRQLIKVQPAPVDALND